MCCRLGYILNEFWIQEGNEPFTALGDGGSFPSSILAEHCVTVWQIAAEFRSNVTNG